MRPQRSIRVVEDYAGSMSREEMAWLWTALKADYRLTFPFKVSGGAYAAGSFAVARLSGSANFVLASASSTASRPFLRRRRRSCFPTPPPFLLSISYPSGQGGAQPNDQVTLSGEFLTGANRVTLTHAELGISFHVTPDTVTAGQWQFTLPPLAPMPSRLRRFRRPHRLIGRSVSGGSAVVGCGAKIGCAGHQAHFPWRSHIGCRRRSRRAPRPLPAISASTSRISRRRCGQASGCNWCSVAP